MSDEFIALIPHDALLGPGYKITPEALEGAIEKCHGQLPIYRGFDLHSAPVGITERLSADVDGLHVEGKFAPDMRGFADLGLDWGVGYSVGKSHMEDGVRVIESGNLMCIGIFAKSLGKREDSQ